METLSMMRWIPRLLVTCALVAGTAAAPGQSKRPADAKTTAAAAPATVQQSWSRTVESFARGLSKGDLAGVGELLAPRATVRQFDGVADDGVWRVFERVS